MIVVDASALLEVVLNRESGDRVGELLFTTGEELHAPELLDMEVLSVLRRYERAGRLTAERSRVARADLDDTAIVRDSHGPLRSRIWSLRHNLTAYDAAYVALAEGLGARLVTLDAGLARAARRFVEVEVP